MPDEQVGIRAGQVTVIAQSSLEASAELSGQLLSRGYTIRETSHFVVCQRPGKNHHAIVLHMFNDATVDEDVTAFISDELGPLGAVTSAQEFSDTHRALVASTHQSSRMCPECGRIHVDLLAAWRQYCMNTMRRLRTLLNDQHMVSDSHGSHVAQFAGIYRRIIECCTGDSVLDVGSSFGFLPMLVAERLSTMTVIGCDNRQDAVVCANDVAAANGTGQVLFLLRDVLSHDFAEVGKFDTVTVVHLLEHLQEAALPRALSNLLAVTSQRLIMAVPYEDNTQSVYGHEQMFTPDKLEYWGRWCVETLGGGLFRREEVNGGLLVVDRLASGVASDRLHGRPTPNVEWPKRARPPTVSTLQDHVIEESLSTLPEISDDS